MYAYFLALALYPEVEAKAHAEMDHVVGRDRLPTFEDRDQLPYVEAICKEVTSYDICRAHAKTLSLLYAAASLASNCAFSK